MQLSPILLVKSMPRIVAVMGPHKSRSQAPARPAGFLMAAQGIRELGEESMGCLLGTEGTRRKEQECSGKQCQGCWVPVQLRGCSGSLEVMGAGGGEGVDLHFGMGDGWVSVCWPGV